MKTITLNIQYPFCHKISNLTVDKKQFQYWRQGVLIQNAMPKLSKSDRELLISGICSLCWGRNISRERE